MTKELFGPVTFGGGARWNPLTKATDTPDMRVLHSILDVVIALRGAVPNLNLGMTDGYLWAGEWELALDEIAAVIEKDPGQSSELAETLLERAKLIMIGDDEKVGDSK